MPRFIWLLILVGVGACCRSDDDKLGKPPEPTPSDVSGSTGVEIWLGAPVEKIQGYTYPPNDNGQRPPFAFAPGLYQITVHFPSGGKFTGASDPLCVSQKDGIVTEVSFLPFPFGDFHFVANAIKQEVNKVKFQNPQSLFKSVDNWSVLAKMPTWRVLGDTGIVEDRLTLFVQIKHWGNDENSGWYGTLGFDYWHDEALWKERIRPVNPTTSD